MAQSRSCPIEDRLIAALKRLASAVRFRPWPPCFQPLTASSFRDLVPIGSKTETNSPRLVITRAADSGTRVCRPLLFSDNVKAVY